MLRKVDVQRADNFAARDAGWPVGEREINNPQHTAKMAHFQSLNRVAQTVAGSPTGKLRKCHQPRAAAKLTAQIPAAYPQLNHMYPPREKRCFHARVLTHGSAAARVLLILWATSNGPPPCFDSHGALGNRPASQVFAAQLTMETSDPSIEVIVRDSAESHLLAGRLGSLQADLAAIQLRSHCPAGHFFDGFAANLSLPLRLGVIRC